MNILNLFYFLHCRRGSSDQLESNYYNIDQIFEMGKMAALFFNKPGRILFYLCLTIYLYGDLVSILFFDTISLKKVDSKFVWSEKWILISRIFSPPTGYLWCSSCQISKRCCMYLYAGKSVTIFNEYQWIRSLLVQRGGKS